jgi:hypothetical protein
MLPGFLRVKKHSGSVRGFEPDAGANSLNLGYRLTIAITAAFFGIPSDSSTIWVMMYMGY